MTVLYAAMHVKVHCVAGSQAHLAAEADFQLHLLRAAICRSYQRPRPLLTP